jgi:hypothetical protein
VSYTPGGAFSRYRDLAGNTVTIPPSGSITVGPKPVIVEQGVYSSAVAEPAPPGVWLRAAPSVTRDATRIVLGAPPAGPARVAIRDVQGRVVRTLAVAPRTTVIDWDCRDERGRPLATGLYFLRVEGAETSSAARVVIAR